VNTYLKGQLLGFGGGEMRSWGTVEGEGRCVVPETEKGVKVLSEREKAH